MVGESSDQEEQMTKYDHVAIENSDKTVYVVTKLNNLTELKHLPEIAVICKNGQN